jgi:periplasmic divalent cation tolerance protein
MNSDAMMVYCTCPDDPTARSIANRIVAAGLAGCVNIVPGLTSFYKWEGEMKSGTEVLLLIKTSADRVDELTSELVSLHPYGLPEVIAVPINGGYKPYLDWIKDCTR